MKEEPIDKLMDENIKWDAQKVWNIFKPRVATAILEIKLSATTRPDAWIWPGEKNWQFSVKSAYFLIQASHICCQGENLNASSLLPIWKNIWNLKIPHNIKIFTWRTYKDALPTLQNLRKK